MKYNSLYSQNNNLLEINDLKKLFPVSRGIINTIIRRPLRYVHAVDGVNLSIKKGEIIALVGESGSGKTTTALCCTGLITTSAGEIRFDGETIHEIVKDKRRVHLLRQQVQVIFQDPYESLNPRQTVFDTVAEPLEVHKLVSSQSEKKEKVNIALKEAGLKPPEYYYSRYPQELSGGQRQRVVIASALVLQPKLVIADEPVSMLDVSIRAEILNLLRKMRDEREITILYITHDLATAAYIADRVAVMYLGVIMEIGSVKSVLEKPIHPYTKALISVIPVPNPRRLKERIILSGETSNPIDLPSGCRFNPRCPLAIENCKLSEPILRELEPGHFVACDVMSLAMPAII